jgi:2-polyprenyl-6-methoxyphenol hydroxylase-like FAD-dependent oxidoreductase
LGQVHAVGVSGAAVGIRPDPHRQRPAQGRRGDPGLPGARGKKEGHISIFWFAHGWYWFIPLSDGVTSVGMVTWPYHLKTRRGSLQDFFLENIAQCRGLAERLVQAELVSEVQATGNFSYACDRSHGSDYVLLGDAYAFIDPVFSSGVMLAMNSAFAGAEAVDTCLRRPEQAAAALADFDRVMRHGPETFSWFIYRITNPTLRNLFMAPRNFFRVKEALLSVLAGDIFGKKPIWRSVRIFKAIYYISALASPVRSLRAWLRHKEEILSVEDRLDTGER